MPVDVSKVTPLKRPAQPVEVGPYTGEVTIVVYSHDDAPEFQVARGCHGPRREFIEQIILRQYGTQSDGSPHLWEMVTNGTTSWSRRPGPDQIDS